MANFETQSESGIVLDRRQLITGATALGLSAAFGSMSALAQSTVKKGGTLRLGMEGGSASDSLDPSTYADAIARVCSLMFWNQLVEIDAKGNATPELAESWEAKPGAAEWIFNIRKGIAFTSGKTLDADDVIFSLNMHRGETKSPAKGLLAQITDITKLSANQISIKLSGGNADLPYVLTDYHLMIVPNGTKDFSKPDGTGAFTLVEWQPGVRVVAKRKPGNYWKPNRGNFDTVELRYILDAPARTQAVMTGQVDAINKLDPKTATLVSKAPNVTVVRTKAAGNRYSFVAHRDKTPYSNNDLILGLKYGIDRQKIINTVFGGYASLGNDHLIGPTLKYYDASQPQRPHDPDKAAFHFKKAGVTSPLELLVSEGAYSGATDSGVLFQESVKKAGTTLDVKRVSGDGYWDNVWLKQPFSAVYWSPRPTVDMQVSTTFLSDAAWNDTRWKRPDFDKLVVAARAELNEAKRAKMYSDAQHMVSDDGGMICFAVGDFLDAHAKNLHGLEPHPRFDLSDNRLPEKGWFA
ncbi:MAG: ABC transporter substrate-binding protein [Comamonadaceae bacterium]|nr:MAG: ABC transporter substrate-binding protein [Comamonadaceae bacterium]